MVRNAEDRDEGAVGYKALFLGAAAVLTLLVPGIVGYIITGLNETNHTQWQRLRELNDENQELHRFAERLQVEHDAHQRALDDQETRLRTLEHHGPRL